MGFVRASFSYLTKQADHKISPFTLQDIVLEPVGPASVQGKMFPRSQLTLPSTWSLK